MNDWVGAVRAAPVAVEALLMRRARWKVGYRRIWIGKSVGLQWREAAFETRAINVGFDEAEVLGKAAQDQSSQVRRIVADYLIKNHSAMTQQMDGVAQALAQDKNAAVREWIEFLLRRVAQAT